MTVASKLLQTIGSLKGVQASIELMALKTTDPAAKEAFLKAVTEMNATLEALTDRLEFVKEEEPQFKV